MEGHHKQPSPDLDQPARKRPEDNGRLTPRQEERFWAKVRQPQGRLLAQWSCWVWQGQTDQAKVLKYGRYVYTSGGKTKNARAHRLMWQLVNGPIPPGLMVLHHCDRPRCVRPAHLYLGTATDNTWDMLGKGRAGGTLPPRGKLTEEDVVEIRRIWAARVFRGYKRSLTMTELGARYGVSGPMIHHIVHRKWWKDVEGTASA